MTGGNPAVPGEYLLIYSTGLGAAPVASGAAAPKSPDQTTAIPTVTIAGLPALVTYSGLAPGFVGLYQINVQTRTGMPAGSQPLQPVAGRAASNTATIATAQERAPANTMDVGILPPLSAGGSEWQARVFACKLSQCSREPFRP